jgi:voltage-gated potassium channel Kch
MPMADPAPDPISDTAEPAMIVIGGDALALSAARELCLIPGHRVIVLWPAGAEFAAAVAGVGAQFVAGRPESSEGLVAAGVRQALSILALSRDDQLNLQSALRARDANPKIRIVLRQFNRTLAAKIEQNLPDCSVLSLAWHSAATYAAAALDPSCFRGLQFPERDGKLAGFAVRSAERDGLAQSSVAEAEAALGVRIVAIDGETNLFPDDPINPGARLIVFGAIEQLLASTPRQPEAAERLSLIGHLRGALHRFYWRLRRVDRFLGGFALAALGFFLLGTWYFHNSFGGDWLTAGYFVLTTMTTTGFGDIAPNHHRPWDVVVAMTLMLAGTSLAGILVAYTASLLTRAQWVRMQGLRPIHRRGHIVVCGAGSIGTGVIDLLLQFDKPMVVVDDRPDAALIERARDRGFELLTGDASRDDTLDLCNLGAAHSLVALTNVDTLNLEIALGARARNPSMPIVLRIAEANFATSIATHFQFETTFSVAALAGPVFAGLSHLPGARGRIALDGREFAIAEIVLPDDIDAALPRTALPVAIAPDGGGLTLVRDRAELRPGIRVLTLSPLSPRREDDASGAARELVAES